MSQLPSGTVTLLFTDIEGSTRLLHQLGDGYADTLAEHRRVLRAAFGRHGGVEVEPRATHSRGVRACDGCDRRGRSCAA